MAYTILTSYFCTLLSVFIILIIFKYILCYEINTCSILSRKRDVGHHISLYQHNPEKKNHIICGLAFHYSTVQIKVVFLVVTASVFLWIYVKHLHVMNHSAVLSVNHLFSYSIHVIFPTISSEPAFF